jgi:thiol-disulfide isomerase/thioredoxin
MRSIAPAIAARFPVIDHAADTSWSMTAAISADPRTPDLPAIPRIDLPAFDRLTAPGATGPAVTIIDFTARWCPPCRTLGRVLEALAGEYAGRVRFVAIDVNDEPALADRFDVRAMPTLVVWRGGREVGRVIGNRPRAFVAGVLDRALAGDVAIAAP